MYPPPARSLSTVQERIESATRLAGRPAASVGLLAVTKGVEPDRALALARLGQRDLGENRVAELERKGRAFQDAGQEVHWHFIGHLQRNKTRRVMAWADTIHSVDSARLLDTIERLARELRRSPRLFLQIDLTGEETKHGFQRADVPDLLRTRPTASTPATAAELCGLMTMAPLSDTDGSAAAHVFSQLADLARELERDADLAARFRGGRIRLSMGMSRDLEQAVAAGADWVRVGSALFPESTPDSNADPTAAVPPGDGPGAARGDHRPSGPTGGRHR